MWRAIYRILLGVGLAAVGCFWNLPAALSSVGTQATFTTLSVDIRPEHDDPRVLVIYRGRVMFLTPAPGFQFEYYADLLSGRPQRTFAVEVAFPLAVEDLEVSVEQPLRSTGFTLTPAPARTATGGGFTYYLYAEDRWPAGKVWSVRGTYRKEDDEPSLPRTAALPGPAPPGVLQPGAAPPAGPGPLIWLLPALLGVIAGVAGTLAVAYLRGARTGRSAMEGTRRGPPKNPDRAKENRGWR